MNLKKAVILLNIAAKTGIVIALGILVIAFVFLITSDANPKTLSDLKPFSILLASSLGVGVVSVYLNHNVLKLKSRLPYEN